MSRTFILASAAAALIALTGTSARAGAIVEGPLKVIAKEVAKIAGHVVLGLVEHDVKQAYKNGALFKSKSADE
jgi:hypothetical protein